MRLRDISAAIFDIDGTLLDSSPMWRDLGERFLQSRGITPQPGLADILAPMTIEESCRYLPDNYTLHNTPDCVRAALLEMISDFYRRECPLRPGAAQLLNALRDRGITLLLATAGDKRLSQAALVRLGVFRLFSGIFTCDEFGSKSRPEIFLAAGFPPSECAVFEDSLTAVLTAKSAGFLTAAVCDISEPQQETLRTTADYYRLTPGDYLDLL